MNSHVFFLRRAFCSPWLYLVIGIGLLFLMLAAAPPASAQTAQPGATDPAANYSRWPDDEIYLRTPPLTDGSPYSKLYETGSTLSPLSLKESAAADPHDAIDAVAGHFLTPEHDSIAQAYRSGADLEVKFYGESTATHWLKDLAPRIAGCTDFFDLAAGELDRLPSGDVAAPDFRDEVVAVYAQPADDLGRLRLQLAVLDVRGATVGNPVTTTVTTAFTLAGPSASAITYAKPYPPHNVVAVATGDFDANGLQEIAVVYVYAPDTLNIDLFRYIADRKPDTGAVTISLAVVGKGSVKLDLNSSLASLSAAAGDFDGDGRAELAVGTSHYISAANRRDVNLRLFRIAGDASLTITQVRNLALRTGMIQGVTGRVEIAAGLFRYEPNPANGWVANRRQLAVAYRSDAREIKIGTIELDGTLAPVGSLAWLRTINHDPSGDFRLAAGGFRGALRPADPTWSLAFASWDFSGITLSALQTFPSTAPATAPAVISSVQDSTATAPTPGARLALVGADTDGDTVYLGAPVHFTIENLVSADYILQEPPKHAYWDSATKQIKNVSRFDTFNMSLVKSTGEAVSSGSKDSTSWAVGGSVFASASGTAKAGADIGVVKAEASATLAISATVGYDYKNEQTSYNNDYWEREVSFSGKTTRDDAILGRIMALDIWRYRVYGVANAGSYPYFDIVLPGPFGEVEMPTYGGGLNYDWYQPVHENGNILSYPKPPSSGSPPALPDDIGSFTTGDGKTWTAYMYPPSEWMFGGAEGEWTLKFQQAGETGTTFASSHSLSANASIKQSATVTGEAFGSGVSATGELGIELHGNYSWGHNATSSATITTTTGIFLNAAPGAGLHGYAYYPMIYTTNDGTIKTAFAVDPTKNAYDFWLDTYPLPDLALNLPARFYPDQDGKWLVNTLISRKQMRGFFVRKNLINPVTGGYDLIPGPVKDGARVRLEARVYNYSAGDYTPVLEGAQACFYKIEFDKSTRKEIGLLSDPLNLIGCDGLDKIAPQEMTVASVEWDTSGAAKRASQEYRIYVRLDTTNLIEEKYDSQEDWTEKPDYCEGEVCIDPGQNNEGFGWVTVATVGYGAPGGVKRAHVGMAKDGVAAIDRKGELATGNVQAYLDRPLEVRITINSDTRSLGYSYVMVYDGDPDRGGVLIASKQVFTGSIDPEGVSVWFDWVPPSIGAHRLYAKVLQSADDSAPGGNIGMLKVEVIPVPPGKAK